MSTLQTLLVEDDDVDAALLRECAGQTPGGEHIRFYPADRLSAALVRLQAVHVDVVLLDLGLPDSQGLETFLDLHKAAPHVPIVVLTGTTDDELARAAVEAGAQDFIGKDQLPHVSLSRVLRYAVERHRLQAELEASETRFRTLVELADDALTRVAVHPTVRLEYVSPAIEAITGFSPDELYADGRLFPERIHPHDRASWSDCSRLAAGHPDRVVYRWRRLDDTWAWLEDRRTPVFTGGRLAAVQAITRDLTAIKQAELVLHDALEQERAAVEKLRSLDEMKTTFLQAVSHELRTPLTAIRGFAATLQQHGDGMPGEQRVLMLDRLVTASGRLQQLLADLLDVDRLARGLITAERRPADVGRLVTSVLSELDTRDHPISVVCQDGLVVPLDAAKVERIVENLLLNAVKHTPPGTPIYVVTEGDADGAIITVADEGPGIPPQEVTRLFEPFAQGRDAGTNASPGTGIGLTLVARFTELHGGRVRVERTPGGGATFVVELPAVSDIHAASSEPSSHTQPVTVSDQHAIVSDAVRQLLHAATVDEISGVMLATVNRLGGSTRVADLQAPDALPLDLSFGTGPPVVPVAPVGSPARTALEMQLPRLLEDARRAVDRCRTHPGVDASTPPGFESRTVLRRLLEQLQDGDALAVIQLRSADDDPWAKTTAAANAVRSSIRAFDRAFLMEARRFVVVLPQAAAGVPELVADRLRATVAERLPGVEVEVRTAMVGPAGGIAAYRGLEGLIRAEKR